MLSQEQAETFARAGWLLLPDVFSVEEVAAIGKESRRIAELDTPQHVFEADDAHVKTVYGVHLLSPLLARVPRDHRLLEPARALLGGDVYLHQTQLNPKAPFHGSSWDWHQDYLYWKRTDGMPRPDALSAAVFIDDVTEFNGPMFVISGSHHNLLEEDTSTEADGLKAVPKGTRHTIGEAALAAFIAEHEMTSVKGSRGSALVLHGSLLHSSTPNLSPACRSMLFIRYNRVDNALPPLPDARPEWAASRNPELLRPLAENLLDPKMT